MAGPIANGAVLNTPPPVPNDPLDGFLTISNPLVLKVFEEPDAMFAESVFVPQSMNAASCDGEDAVQVTVPVVPDTGVYQLNPILHGPSAGSVVGFWLLLSVRPNSPGSEIVSQVLAQVSMNE